MRRVVNLLRGSVQLEASGPFPERFLNLCAQEGVSFWGVERPTEERMRLRVAWTDRNRLEELAERSGCRLTELGSRGIPSFLRRFRTRYALLTGLALSLAAVCLLSRFVFVIQVEGNESVPERVIRAELWRQGLRPGAYGPGLPVRDISNLALLQLRELSWMTVNLHGIRAQVIVREREPEPKPLDRNRLGDIVARTGGIVTALEPWSGDGVVRVGDTVAPGEVLIRGSLQMDPPQYSELETRFLPVRAMGRVEGRTWRTISALCPQTAPVKRYNGGEHIRLVLNFWGRSMIFFGKSGIPFDRYDKIIRIWNLTLPGGHLLPVSLELERCRSYELTSLPVDAAAVRTMLEQRLRAMVTDQVGERGQVLTCSFAHGDRAEGFLTTLTAECREEMGRFVPAEPDHS